jgi:Flp pilus assembly protein TadD
VRLDPKNAPAHNNLGNALRAKGDPDGAIQAYQQAVQHDPKLARAYNGMGIALLEDKRDVDGAIKAFQEALKLNPMYALAHTNLGNALSAKKDWDAAIQAYQEALRLDPKNASAQHNLGVALRDKGNLDGAIEAFQEALRLNPKNPRVHYNLGAALRTKGDLEGAFGCFQEALRLSPTYALARNDLRQIEPLRLALPHLSVILEGRAEPVTPTEGCTFARLCAEPSQKRFAAATRLYAQAFAADPKLADDPSAFHRYYAACCAARSARGDGVDGPSDPRERATLRSQALAWLRADLALRQKQAASANPAERQTSAASLSHWLANSDLAGVRPGKEPLALPAAERAEWEALWADVQATRVAAQAPPLPRDGKRP